LAILNRLADIPSWPCSSVIAICSGGNEKIDLKKVRNESKSGFTNGVRLLLDVLVSIAMFYRCVFGDSERRNTYMITVSLYILQLVTKLIDLPICLSTVCDHYYIVVHCCTIPVRSSDEKQNLLFCSLL
jgi:hypothetical protein